MSKGGLSASMGPSHLLFIIIRIEDHLMKVLIIMRNDGMEWNGMEWWKPSTALLFQDYYQINLPPLFRQRCALQVVETSPVRRKAGLNSPEDCYTYTYSTCGSILCLNLFVSKNIKSASADQLFDLHLWWSETLFVPPPRMEIGEDWPILKDPHQQRHMNTVASSITEIMLDLMDSSISKESGCCWPGILGQGSPSSWRNVRAALSDWE